MSVLTRGVSCLGAFIIPNKPIKGEASLTKYQVPLKELENHLGVKLLPQLSPERVSKRARHEMVYQCIPASVEIFVQ